VAKRDGDPRRLGEVLAEQIEDEIIANGWPVGTVIGSEVELLERYGVSRATFREAVRIVDFHGVASMRRGPGGGLVVAVPDLDAIVRAVTLQMHYWHVAPAQLTEARVTLELAAIDMATQRLGKAGATRLQEYLDGEKASITEGRSSGRVRGRNPTHDFHILLASMSGNPAVELFVRILGRLTGEYSLPDGAPIDEVADAVHVAHTRIAEAMIDGDAVAAKRRMQRHLDSVTDFLHPDTPAPSRRTRRSGAER
jgi:DNA-binding FadR family transcriptional regulator